MMPLSAKSYWLTLAGLVLFELLSWLAYSTPGLMAVFFWAAVAAMMFLAWYRPTWVALAGLAELVVGSKGYLLFTTFRGQAVSLRMILFVGLVLSLIRLWPKLNFDWPKNLAGPLVALLVWVGVMTTWGVIRGNALGAVYTDVNAFLYALVFFGWWLVLRQRPMWRQDIFAMLLAGGTLIGIKSWVMMVLFGQNVSAVPEIYRWIRNTGVGEITLISGNVYRVFFQSQVYALLVFTVTFIGYVWHQVPRWWAWPLIGSALGLYLSLSRSFWLGLLVALVVIAVMLVRQKGWLSLKRFWLLLPLSLCVWLFNSWAINWPYVFTPIGRAPQANSILSRLTGTSSAQAATARRNQIQPLLAAISHHPVIGSGFGTSVTYYSTDPRVKGWRTTTAFELGYLDLVLKMGLVGLGLYAWWLWSISRQLAKSHWLIYFLPGLVALVVTHLTSPYLNHPLGLGWLALVSLYAADR